MKNLNITKQVFLLLLMIIGGGSLKAQETEYSYVPFPTENAQWSVANEKYALYGDTIIDEIKYGKIYKQTSDSLFEFDINKAEYFCAIRNDVESKRVYGIYKEVLPIKYYNTGLLPAFEKEMLLYDFSLDMGDTVTVANFDEADRGGYISYNKYIRVEAISIANYFVDAYVGNHITYELIHFYNSDSIFTLENNEHRKRILLLGDKVPIAACWIEGIGSSSGPFVHDVYDFLEYYPKRLLCYKEDDEYMYYQHEFDYNGDCYSTGFNVIVDVVENNMENEIQIYPNPSKDIINIKIPSDSDCFVNIYNDMGQMLISEMITGQSSITVSHLPRGIYVINLNYDDKNKNYKLIKN